MQQKARGSGSFLHLWQAKQYEGSWRIQHNSRDYISLKQDSLPQLDNHNHTIALVIAYKGLDSGRDIIPSSDPHLVPFRYYLMHSGLRMD
jgi:hypothetical protein